MGLGHPHLVYLPRKMFVMDKQEYMDKAIGLLSGTNTYRTVLRTPPRNLKPNLLAYSRASNKHAESRTQPFTRFTLAVQPSKVLWPPKNPQSWHPLRPIVSSRGSITYGVAKELASIIHPLVGQSQHHLKNT